MKFLVDQYYEKDRCTWIVQVKGQYLAFMYSIHDCDTYEVRYTKTKYVEVPDRVYKQHPNIILEAIDKMKSDINNTHSHTICGTITTGSVIAPGTYITGGGMTVTPTIAPQPAYDKNNWGSGYKYSLNTHFFGEYFKGCEYAQSVTTKNVYKLKDGSLVTEQPASKTPMPVKDWWNSKKEEGNNPMATKYNDYSANAAIVSAPSDTAVTRDYLLSRLTNIGTSRYSTKGAELREMFRIGTDPAPKTYKQLIDAIKNDKFKLDEKRIKRAELDAEDDDEDREEYSFDRGFYGPMDGIIWDGPKPDEKGYEKAIKELNQAYLDTKDAIMVKDAEAGLEALKAYENWKPSNAPSTDTVQ